MRCPSTFPPCPALAGLGSLLVLAASVVALPAHARDYPLASDRLEAATPQPTELGLAGRFFELYSVEECLATELGNSVFLYTCQVDGKPQEFQFDLAIPGLVVLTSVSLNGETANLDESLIELGRQLGVPPANIHLAPSTLSSRPVYAGAWGHSQQNCSEHYEFYINTVIGRRQLSEGFRSCMITASNAIGSTHILALSCLDPDEHTPFQTLARLTMDTNDRITLEKADGTIDHLLRCKGPFPPEYQAIVDE